MKIDVKSRYKQELNSFILRSCGVFAENDTTKTLDFTYFFRLKQMQLLAPWTYN